VRVSAVTAGMYASVPDYIWRCDTRRGDVGLNIQLDV